MNAEPSHRDSTVERSDATPRGADDEGRKSTAAGGGDRSKKNRPLLVIGVVLLLWAILLGIGVWLNSDANVVKALVIVATMGGFLGLWWLALWRRGRRQQGQQTKSP